MSRIPLGLTTSAGSAPFELESLCGLWSTYCRTLPLACLGDWHYDCGTLRRSFRSPWQLFLHLTPHVTCQLCEEEVSRRLAILMSWEDKAGTLGLSWRVLG